MAQAATSRAVEVQAGALSREALRYGALELARRAGVSPEQSKAWRFEFGDLGAVTIFLLPGSAKRLVFPKIPEVIWSDVLTGKFRTSTAQWMKEPSANLESAIPDFKIPFSSSCGIKVGPLFSLVRFDSVECAVNLPASTVLTLSRYEETLPIARDEHGRFRTASSTAWAGGFHDRPIVDEYGAALEQALRALLPGWEPVDRKFRVMLGHDVDEIGLPFNLHSTVAHTLKRQRPAATLRDLLAPIFGIDTAYMSLLRKMVALSIKTKLSSTVYWKFSAEGPHDTGYDPRDSRVQSCLKALRGQGIEMGIHPGYETFERPERFSAEVEALTDVLETRDVGGRQDFLRWNPASWLAWEAEGLSYDASVGFADWTGFRAGTCHPYRPWLLSENREARLLEIPIIAMDSALRGYMKLTPAEALAALRGCVARCRTVGGVFHLVWHSTTMMDSGYAKTYRTLLRELAGSPAYAVNGED